MEYNAFQSQKLGTKKRTQCLSTIMCFQKVLVILRHLHQKIKHQSSHQTLNPLNHHHPQQEKKPTVPFPKSSSHRPWAAPPQSPYPNPLNPPKAPATPHSDPTKAPRNSAPAPWPRGLTEPNTSRTGPRRQAASKPAAQGQTVESDRCTRCTKSGIKSGREGGIRGRDIRRRGCL